MTRPTPMRERIIDWSVDNVPPLAAYFIASWLFFRFAEFSWLSAAGCIAIFVLVQFGAGWAARAKRWNEEHPR